MQVADLMAMELVTVTANMTLKQAEKVLTTNVISGAPVLDAGTLVGVISQSDIVRVLYDQQVAASEVSQYLLSPYPIPMPAVTEIAKERAHIADQMNNMRVAEIMTTVPVTVAPDDDVSVAAAAMCDERIHRVLVTDGDQLVGVLSALDLAGLLAKPTE